MANPATALTGIVGQTLTVKSFQVDAYGAASNTPVVWSSSNGTVAGVQSIFSTNNAVIYCFALGTATITATMGTVTNTIALTVVSGVAGVGASLDVEIDQGFQPVTRTIQTVNR